MAETRRLSDEMHLRGKDLVFDSPFTSADYFLIEVDTKLADDVLNGKELVVRGNVHDHVTICTEDTTYATKEVEISNTLLVAENLEPNMNMATCPKIISLHNTYIELKPTKFLLFHLKRVLFEMLDMYDFEEPEEPKNKVNFENLLNTIQMSAGELQEAIQKLPIIEDKGTLFMLSARSINKLLDDVIRLCDDDIYPDIAIDKITFEELREPLSELIPDSAIYWFLREFCDFNGNHYVLNEDKVCKSRAEMVLRDKQDHTWESTKFFEVMSKLLPIGLIFKLEHLRGLAMFGETAAKGRTIQFFDGKELPIEPKKRLHQLFTIKSSWCFEDIEPFIADICDSKTSVEEILAKFCFCSKRENKKFYTLKLT